MSRNKIRIVVFFILSVWVHIALAQIIYIDPENGLDTNNGSSPESAKRSLNGVQAISFAPGAHILIKAGTVIRGALILRGVKGTPDHPIAISSYWEGVPAHFQPALIDGAGQLSAIQLDDCSYVTISKLRLTANGGFCPTGEAKTAGGKKVEAMRVGLLVRAITKGVVEHIHVSELTLSDVFYENPGYVRDPKDTHTANGTQGYGYGIRFISTGTDTKLRNISVKRCLITRMSHTGIKFSGKDQNISDVELVENKVYEVGGPGMQLSQTRNCYIARNTIDRSGCPDDSRSWKRGSGMWMFGSEDFLIEHNRFTNANGPNDSAGAHIDYNNKNIVFQYNFSANNAGGFVEILGNCWNCCYRYNISVNDGWRRMNKTVGGGIKASHSGEIIWLSGYVGEAPKLGPYYTYIYNNTIYTDERMTAGYFFQHSLTGLLIANNVFHIAGESASNSKLPHKVDHGDVMIQNNLFCRKENWPSDEAISDSNPIYGQAEFRTPGGLDLADYIPSNRRLIKGKGIKIQRLPNDSIGVKIGLEVVSDILGTPIGNKPGLGAIVYTTKSDR